jgi:hypothetical protein
MTSFIVQISEPTNNVLEIQTSAGDAISNTDIIQYDSNNLIIQNAIVPFPADYINAIDTEISSFLKAGSGINLISNISGVNINVSGLNSSYISNFNSSVDSRITNANLQPSGNYAASSHNHASSGITDFNSSVSGLLPITSLVPSTGIGITQSGTVFTIAITGTLGSTQSQTDIDARVNFLTSGVYAPLSGAVFTGSVSGPSGNFTSLSVNGTGLFTSGIITGSGSASSPSHSFIGNTNAGLYNPATNAISLATSGIDRLYVDSLGNVGINTTVPQNGFKLDVNGAAVIRGSILTNSTIQEFGNSRYQLHAGTASNSVSYVCNGGGRFGVGFTAPSGLVAISGGVAIGSDYNIAPPTNGMIVQGRVGIGTTSPNESLEVSGNIRLSDTATSAGHRLQLFRGGGSAYDYTLSKEGYHIALSTANDASTTRSVQIGSHVSGVWIPKIHLNGWTGAVGINNTYTNIQSSMLVVRGSGNTSSTSTVNFTNSSNISLFSVRDDGMVGIGTTTPSGQLHVIGTGIFSSGVGVGINTPLDLIHVSGSSLNAQGIRIDNGDGYGGSIQADNNALVMSSPTAIVCRLQASKIRMGDGTSSTAIELTSNGSISQNGNGGGLTFSGTTAQFSNGINVTNSGIFSSGIVVGNGTVSNPSIAFDGFRNTGFSATSNVLEASVLGNRVMRMSQFGTVAINRGTASALGTLHVQGNGSNPANTSDPIVVTSSVGSGSIIRFTDSASNDWQIGVNPNGSVATGTGSGNFAITRVISNSGVPYITINSSGNVGIGTISPSEKLEVVGNIKANNIIHPFLLGGM